MLEEDVQELVSLKNAIHGSIATIQRQVSASVSRPLHYKEAVSPGSQSYVYLEEERSNKTDRKYPKYRHRALSAGNAEDKRTSLYNGSLTPSKTTFSDSKILKKNSTIKTTMRISKNRNGCKTQIDTDSVKQLKHDMKAIKDQLSMLTKTKTEALEITQELEVRYNKLQQKSQQQQSEIERLQEQNMKLSARNNGAKFREMMEVKQNLDQYEAKLSQLYNEFLESSKIMEESRNKICKCVKEKSNDFYVSKDQFTQALKHKDHKYDQLSRMYEELKERTDEVEGRNQQLRESMNNLENELNQALEATEILRKGEAILKKQQEEMKVKNFSYIKQLEEKSRAICKMTRAVEELKKHVCDCTKTSDDYKVLKTKHEELATQHKMLLQKFKTNEIIDFRKHQENQRLIDTMRTNELKLIQEQQKLKTFAAELTTIVNELEETVAQMGCSLQEKEFVIQSQITELAAKNRQLQLSNESLLQLRRRNVDEQDEPVVARNESLPHLTEELQELIAALYVEIDKVLAKEQIIRYQFRDICALRCLLAAKEKQLVCLKTELEMAKQQMTCLLKGRRLYQQQTKEFDREQPINSYTKDELNDGDYDDDACQQCCKSLLYS